MNQQIADVMCRQHGLVLRRQALAAGMGADHLARLLRTGEWVAVRWGVYTTAARWEAVDEYVGRPRLEALAASLGMVMPHVVSHDSAAYLHGLPILEARPRLAHITRFGALGGRTKSGVKHHKAPFAPAQIAFVDDVPVLDLARTVADIAREHGSRHGIVAASSALRAGVTRRQLELAVAPMRSWPQVTVCRLAVDWADGRCETPGEALVLLMVKELGLGDVEPQFGLREDGRTAWVDLRVGRHLIEFDGRLKYDDPADLWEEKRRQDWLCGFKLGMTRLSWTDVQVDVWKATQRRLLRDIRDTNARFGVNIDDLAPYRTTRGPR
ncbi:MAG: type IV toxin-antitoxin system AbiEi family antitoxin domain-containing protein [Nocardioides sp.]